MTCFLRQDGSVCAPPSHNCRGFFLEEQTGEPLYHCLSLWVLSCLDCCPQGKAIRSLLTYYLLLNLVTQLIFFPSIKADQTTEVVIPLLNENNISNIFTKFAGVCTEWSPKGWRYKIFLYQSAFSWCFLSRHVIFFSFIFRSYLHLKKVC